MLTKKQIEEIRLHLSKAQNPLFLFDNDGDGLCSFLLLQRAFGKGKGIPIKTFPELSSEYFRRINELNADYIFILDKPLVSKAFFDEAEQINIPIVWIDHHEINRKNIPKFVNYYNPFFNRKKSSEPVTYLSYKIANKEEDSWIALIGCICDNFVPEFYRKILKKYPDLTIDSKKASEIYYNSLLGKIAQMFNFGLKDRISNVVKMLKFLMKVKNPYDILEENPENRTIHQRFEEINKKYEKFMEKASSADTSNNLIFFRYGGDLSISADIANGLIHKFPDKTIAVAYVAGAKTNISLRGKKLKKIIAKVIEQLEDATGGGHEEAVGAKIRTEDLEKFREKLKEEVGNG